MTGPRRILIVRLSSLGDILHALPAFWSLKSTFPQSEIDWIAEERTRFLLASVPGIRNIHVLSTREIRNSPFRASAWQSNWRTIRQLRARRYDVALDFQGLLKSAFLTLASGARLRFGFSGKLVRERPAHWFYNRTLPKPPSQIHIVAQNLLLASMAGARPTNLPVSLRGEPADEAAVSERLSDAKLSEFVVINPGGGWRTKRWIPVKYGVLAQRIAAEAGLGVVVTTGPGEERLYEEIARNSGDRKPVHLSVTFLQLVPLLRRARLFIGGDTGPFHLACLLGTPVVGIFGPTSPVRNGPWAAGDETVVRVLPCSYCNGRTCPTGNECMDISADDVFQAVLNRLRTARRPS